MRVRRGYKARRRRAAIKKMAKGFHFGRRRKFKSAAETVMRALHYAYIGRRLLKRDQRRLWVLRISAGVRTLGGSYSVFMHHLKKRNCTLNRKMLAEIAARDAEGLKAIYQTILPETPEESSQAQSG